MSFTEYWRAMGLLDAMGQNKCGQDLFVRKATVGYLAATRFDDMLDVGARCARLGTASMIMVLEIYRGAEHLISGELAYVLAETAQSKSMPIPHAWRERLCAFEKNTAVH